MLQKLNYPMLGLVVQLLASPLLIVLRLLNVIEWSWSYVIGLPIMVAATLLMTGLIEYMAATAPADSKAPVRRRSQRPIL